MFASRQTLFSLGQLAFPSGEISVSLIELGLSSFSGARSLIQIGLARCEGVALGHERGFPALVRMLSAKHAHSSQLQQLHVRSEAVDAFELIRRRPVLRLAWSDDFERDERFDAA